MDLLYHKVLVRKRFKLDGRWTLFILWLFIIPAHRAVSSRPVDVTSTNVTEH